MEAFGRSLRVGTCRVRVPVGTLRYAPTTGGRCATLRSVSLRYAPTNGVAHWVSRRYVSVRVRVATCRFAHWAVGHYATCRFATRHYATCRPDDWWSLRYATLRVGTGTYGYLSVRVATLRFAHSRNKNSVARTKTM